VLRGLLKSNAAVSRNLCAVCFVVPLSDSETTRQTARKLSACTALLGSFFTLQRDLYLALTIRS